jgi:hypothetical protein
MIHYILDSNSLFKLTKEREENQTEEKSDMTLQFSLEPKISQKILKRSLL